ncbi:MAG TPA: hypothetical protein VLS53_02760, partial [Candidatus Dormibacteraeota bacterium]|nr:hypothetical protein [Candidatus Dormibacteraeota bacterium]
MKRMNGSEILECSRLLLPVALAIALFLATPVFLSAQAPATPAAPGYVVNDSHFHLTNYVQQGPELRDFIKIMGTKVGRSTLFGIPLQQQWSYSNTGDYAPTYYL